MGVASGAQVCSGQGDNRIGEEEELGSDPRDLEASLPLIIPDQQVGSTESEEIERSGHRHSVALVAVASQVLDGGKEARLADFDDLHYALSLKVALDVVGASLHVTF